jgi:regulator of sirC expression with transglutaminase-like and TPR domain
LEILLRQLRNLKSVYGERGDVEKTLNIINHMLVIDEDLLPELLERAALYDSLGYARGAVDDYARALASLPGGAEKTEVQERLERARERAQQLH